MPTLAILPIKSFSEAKQRLADELNPGFRRALVQAMFLDVLLALRRTGGLDQLLVVTADHVPEQIALGHGALVVDDLERGHSEAAGRGIRRALELGSDRVLLVPGDCPLLDPVELEQLLAWPAGGRSALIVPDRHGTGTNALLLSPPDALAPSFGPGSCSRHLEEATRGGSEGHVLELSSLALDVDTPEDLHALQAALAGSRGRAGHTRGMLTQLERSRA